MVLNDLDGSWGLASAAYNAGPGRPKQWRQSLTKTVDGAIYAETIPFNETRTYVKNVLANAVFYGTLYTGKAQSLKEKLVLKISKFYVKIPFICGEIFIHIKINRP